MLTKIIPLRIVVNGDNKYRIVAYDDKFIFGRMYCSDGLGGTICDDRIIEFDTLQEAQDFVKKNTWHYVTNVPN